MKPLFFRLAGLVALLSVLAFAIHTDPAHRLLTPDASHGCAVCHTAGIQPVAIVSPRGPSEGLSQPVLPKLCQRLEPLSLPFESPRGPPTV